MYILKRTKWLCLVVLWQILDGIEAKIVVSVGEKNVYSSVGKDVIISYDISSTDGKPVADPMRIDIDARPVTNIGTIYLLVSVTFTDSEPEIVTFTQKNDTYGRVHLPRIGNKVDLKLTGLMESDFDMHYRCTVFYEEFNEPFNSVKLLKADPPSIWKTSFFPRDSIIRDTSDEYICRASGTPSPQVSWVKQESGAQRSAGLGQATLSIVKAKIEDADTYVCKAKNPGGVDESTMVLIVTYIERQLGKSFDENLLNEGGTISAKCNIVGYPTPVYKWRDPLGRVISTKMKLTYGNIGKNEFGNYTCFANNTAGALAYTVLITRNRDSYTTTTTITLPVNNAVTSRQTYLPVLLMSLVHLILASAL